MWRPIGGPYLEFKIAESKTQRHDRIGDDPRVAVPIRKHLHLPESAHLAFATPLQPGDLAKK